MIVSIHQPNYFPFEGVLIKAKQSDRFVVLNHAQFTRGNYHNRFHLDDDWHTMSVNQRLEPLHAKTYTKPHEDWAKIKRRLPAYASELSLFDSDIEANLTACNIKILRRLLEQLEIRTEVVVDYPTAFTSTARLVDLCKHYGATTYLSGPSGAKYMEEDLFRSAGIRVEYQQSTTQRRAAVELLKERS
jgi:WbqC-like protein family